MIIIGNLRVEIVHSGQHIDLSVLCQSHVRVVAVFFCIQDLILIDIEGILLAAQFYGWNDLGLLRNTKVHRPAAAVP